MNLPNLSAAKLISYDLETKDPYLREDGPGWGRGVGHILGVAIVVDDWEGYIPVGEHPDPNIVRWLKDTLETPTPKVGANLQYDYGWLTEIDVWPGGLQYDIQYAEALLDDVGIDSRGRRRSISLDALGAEYLGEKKENSEIQAINQDKWPWSKDPRENLWRMPPDVVGRYALQDARMPPRILNSQFAALKREGLWDLFEMECELIPLLVHMRRRGMPVDIDKATEARDDMLLAEKLMKQELSKKAGFKINVNSSKDLGYLFEKVGVAYGRTDKGNPSFTADFLNACDAPIAAEVINLRKLIKARSTFIENAILGKEINGKIYPSLHPLRNDEGGTISGRFSCSKPNGQQIPKRDAQWAPIIRGMFSPEEGYESWASMDLSQIEYRFFAHYSEDHELITQYKDPHTDFHAAVGKIVGGNLPRIAMKTINFGLLYGMGRSKLTAQLAKFFPDDANPEKKAREVYDTYQARFPAAANLLKKCASQVSHEPHEIRTILGRKSRFTLYEDAYDRNSKAYPLAIARSKYDGNIRTAGAYKAINRLLQGSAADQMKKGMVDAFKAGIFEKTGYPHITIHDELCLSYHRDLHKHFEELRSIVEKAIPLKVPVVMGLATGPTWGECS